MAVTLLYFARFREKLGITEESLDAPTPTTVADITAMLTARGGQWEELFSCGTGLMVAINEQMASLTDPVEESDTVAFFPPVTGG